MVRPNDAEAQDYMKYIEKVLANDNENPDEFVEKAKIMSDGYNELFEKFSEPPTKEDEPKVLVGGQRANTPTNVVVARGVMTPTNFVLAGIVLAMSVFGS